MEHKAKQPPYIPGETFTVRFVMTASVAVIAICFAFGFGNVWELCNRFGIHPAIAPLVNPAVDLSYLGLMVGQQYLALRGWTDEELARPRRWLILVGLMTYGLNCGDAVLSYEFGRAAIEAVPPTLLMIWGSVGPWLMRQVHYARQEAMEAEASNKTVVVDYSPLIDVAREQMMEDVSRVAREMATEARTAEESTSGGRKPSPLRDDVREFLRGFKGAGLTKEDAPVKAFHKLLMKQYPEKEYTERWARKLVEEEWDNVPDQDKEGEKEPSIA